MRWLNDFSSWIKSLRTRFGNKPTTYRPRPASDFFVEYNFPQVRQYFQFVFKTVLFVFILLHFFFISFRLFFIDIEISFHVCNSNNSCRHILKTKKLSPVYFFHYNYFCNSFFKKHFINLTVLLCFLNLLI